MTLQNEAGSGLPSDLFRRKTEKLRNQVDLECLRCGEPFRGDPDGDGLCSRCGRYAQVPADASGAFNWYQKKD